MIQCLSPEALALFITTLEVTKGNLEVIPEEYVIFTVSTGKQFLYEWTNGLWCFVGSANDG